MDWDGLERLDVLDAFLRCYNGVLSGLKGLNVLLRGCDAGCIGDVVLLHGVKSLYYYVVWRSYTTTWMRCEFSWRCCIATWMWSRCTTLWMDVGWIGDVVLLRGCGLGVDVDVDVDWRWRTTAWMWIGSGSECRVEMAYYYVDVESMYYCLGVVRVGLDWGGPRACELG